MGPLAAAKVVDVTPKVVDAPPAGHEKMGNGSRIVTAWGGTVNAWTVAEVGAEVA